jgi:hypothetical protein
MRELSTIIHKKQNKRRRTTTAPTTSTTHSIMTEETIIVDDKKTPGEELYLVHLSRFSKLPRSENDFDHETKEPRKRSFSAGEELWQIHLKRSAGLDPEADEDKEPTIATVTKKLKVGRPVTKKIPKLRVIHLRNRNVKIPSA